MPVKRVVVMLFLCFFALGLMAENMERIPASSQGPMEALEQAGKDVHLLYALRGEDGKALKPWLYRRLKDKYFLLPQGAEPRPSETCRLLSGERGRVSRLKVRGRSVGYTATHSESVEVKSLERKVLALEAEIFSLRAQVGTLGKEVVQQRTEISRLESERKLGTQAKPGKASPQRPVLWKKPFANLPWSRSYTKWILGTFLVLGSVALVLWLLQSGRLRRERKYWLFGERVYREDEFQPWYKRTQRPRPQTGYSGEETVRTHKRTKDEVSPEEPPPVT